MGLLDMVSLQSVHFKQTASTTKPKKQTKKKSHLLAVTNNRINRTIHCPLIYNGHLPILNLLLKVLQFCKSL